jgi:hypothetical protein
MLTLSFGMLHCDMRGRSNRVRFRYDRIRSDCSIRKLKFRQTLRCKAAFDGIAWRCMARRCEGTLLENDPFLCLPPPVVSSAGADPGRGRNRVDEPVRQDV